jgi:hypothetical protein
MVKGMKLLGYIVEQGKTPGVTVAVQTDDPVVLGVGWAVGSTEIRWQLINSLTAGLQLLETTKDGSIIHARSRQRGSRRSRTPNDGRSGSPR